MSRTPLAKLDGLRPEAELLYACVGVEEEPGRARRIASLVAGDLDWPFVVRCAVQNRVLGLVHHGLAPVARELVPEEAHLALGSHDRKTRFRNLHHLHETLALVREIEARGGQVVPYKGPALGALLYEDLALREYSDLDLLVRREDLPAAREVVRQRGYESLDDLTPASEPAYLDADCELHYRHPETGVLLELHWEVLPRRHAFGFRVADLWERLVTVDLSGVPCRAFAPEDLLLVLCIHGGEKHGWMRLQMLADVARLLVRHELDWDSLWRRAAAIRRTETVELGLYLARTLLEAPLPEPELARIRSRRSVRVQAALARGKPFCEGFGLPGYGEWRAYLDDLSTRTPGPPGPTPAPDGRLAYLLGVLRPEWNDRQGLDLPRGLGWLHYLHRPLRLLRIHRAGLFRRLHTPVRTE